MDNLIAKLQRIVDKYEEIGKQIVDPDVIANQKRYVQLSKEYKELEDIVVAFRQYKGVVDNLQNSKAMLATETDPEFKQMAEEEIKSLQDQKVQLEDDIKWLLIPKDPDDTKNIIMEIRGGTGGDEAAIFAGDLYEMYIRFFDIKGWRHEVLNVNEGTAGGYKEISFLVEGENVYGNMKFESGVHRVQRVPATETQGRVHTSAATVAVLPEAEEVDVEINMADVRRDTYRASGAGGQHVNKTESAVRLTHIPTGVVAECQEERSQFKNFDKALKMLRSRIYEAEVIKREQARAAERKSQVSTGDRSAKIRTYNFPQGRCTDHRIGLTLYNLDAIMKGDLQGVVDALKMAENAEKLQAGINNEL
ncbi:MAG TPA: peptide chain release factor 1 [Luteibaculaceae bacterium]|nr:peptide chain release factor 1 [Luteibaculaceae bacterium]